MDSVRNRIRGMIIGGAIGDALGMPVETWTPEKILQIHPEGLGKYITPKDHKWFDPEKTPAGSTTDDTQLTLATMQGFIAGHEDATKQGRFECYMDDIAVAHCLAMQQSDAGWGKTTREAVRRLQNNVSWELSGKTSEPHRGTGNGVPMKISPFAAWALSPASEQFYDQGDFLFHQWCVSYSAMTHWTRMSAIASIFHVNAVMYCLSETQRSFNAKSFMSAIATGGAGRDLFNVDYLNETQDSINDQMVKLYLAVERLPTMSQSDIITEFGQGSCYVYESLPFSYAFFLRNPYSFETIRQTAEAGGDTDTNAKLVGEMFGALHGYESLLTYAPWAVEGLIGKDQLLAVTDQFCDTFGII